MNPRDGDRAGDLNWPPVNSLLKKLKSGLVGPNTYNGYAECELKVAACVRQSRFRIRERR